MVGLGKRLLEARKNMKYTQEDVAEHFGINAQSVSKWEKEENAPDIDKLAELAELYKVTLDWLLTGNMPEKEILEITANLSDRLFDEDHQYTFVKASANAQKFYQTLRILPYCRRKHNGQVRKGKDRVPFVSHPLTLACHALALHLYDDNMISAALLHDVCEDCDVLVEDLPVNDETREAVRLLTKSHKGMSDEELHCHYSDISKNKISSMIKLLDRCNNLSGMSASFSKGKMAQYVKETEKYIYPIFTSTAEKFPELIDALFLILYHMLSVVECVKHNLSSVD